MRRARRLQLGLLVVASVHVFLCRRLLLGELPVRGDLARLFLPLKHHLAEELHAWRFPHWWPWDGLGAPLASQPLASTFHPTTLLYAVLPFQPAFALQFFLPLPLAAWSSWRLARALGTRAPFAAVTAAAYSLGGYVLSNTEFTFSSLAAAALPLVALGALRLRAGRGPAWLAGALALVALAGDPVLVYLSAGTALCLALRPRAKELGRLVLAGAAGLLVAAVQLAPTAAMFFESSRAKGTVHGATFWALGPAQLLGFVVPPARTGELSFLYASTYLGVLTVALAALGIASRGRRRGALLVVAALSLGLAVGDALPLWRVASSLPLWSAFRFPAKAMGPFVLVVALFAGRGAQVLSRRVRALRRPLGATALIAVMALELAAVNGIAIETAPASTPALATTLKGLGVSLDGPSYAWRWELPPGVPETTARVVEAVAPAYGALHGLPTSNSYLPGYSSAYADLNARSQWTWLGPLAPMFGSRFVVMSPRAVTNEHVVARDEGAGAVVVEYERALPRAYVCTGVRRAARAAVPALLAHESFSPGAEVFLASEDPGPAERPSTAAFLPASVHHEGTSAEVRATVTVPSMLVLNESYFAGVRAFEGERELPVLRVNHLVRGVELAPGEHAVRFDYRTPALWLGVVLSLAGLALVVAWQRQAVRRLSRAR